MREKEGGRKGERGERKGGKEGVRMEEREE